MNNKPTFFFDYIYFRITQAYFKWDGRTGATALVAIMMVQTLTIGTPISFFIRLLYSREVTSQFGNMVKWIVVALSIGLFIYNYRKYNGTYNKFRLYWKNENKKTRFYKGVLIIICLILSWVPLILIGTLM